MCRPRRRTLLGVVAVDGDVSSNITEDLLVTRPLLHVGWVGQCWRCRIRCADLPVDMLQQAATAMHIQELHPATDAEDRKRARIRSGDRLPLQLIARNIHLNGAINCFVVAIWMYVRTTREEEPLHAGEGGRALLCGCVGGDQDRQPAGATDPIGVSRVHQCNACRFKIGVVICNGDHDEWRTHDGYARTVAGFAAASCVSEVRSRFTSSAVL